MSWYALWGSGVSLDPLQMAVRSAAFFLLLLGLIRLGGARLSGRMSTFDHVVMIVLGAVAARGIAGAAPTGSTVAACAVLVVLHRLCARLAVRSPIVRRAIEGHRIVLYRDGTFDCAALARTALSEDELFATLRIETHADTFASVHEAALETNGKISFVSSDHASGSR